MTPPVKFKGKDGAVVDLNWTRLKTVEEVGARSPLPMLPDWRPGLTFGEDVQRTVGLGFDRCEVIEKPVVADNGVHVIRGKTLHARRRPNTTNPTYEPNRPWTPADLAWGEREALAILKTHDFPADREWPNPGAWTWWKGGLWWADAPADDGWLILEDGREEAVSLAMYRGGLDWFWTGHPQSPEAAKLWPPFSPFGWALELHELLAAARRARARFKALVLNHAQLGVPEMFGPDRPDVGNAIGEAAPRWIDSGIDEIWNLAFNVGGYLAEYRDRLAHGELLVRGQNNLKHNTTGAQKGNKSIAARVARDFDHATYRAREVFDGPLPVGRKYWTMKRLADELTNTWKLEEKIPDVSTVKKYLIDFSKTPDGAWLKEIRVR